MERKRDLFLVMAYAPDAARETMLRNLVKQLKTLDQDIMLVSHTIQSTDIICAVDYYLYDKDNHLIPLYETENFDVFDFDGIYMQTQLNIFNRSNHDIAALKMLYGGLSLAKALGYKTVVQLEFDTELMNPNYLLELHQHLDWNDCFFFGEDENFADLQVNGFYLDSYSSDELSFDLERLKRNLAIGENHGMAEKVLVQELLVTKKYFICDRNQRKDHMVIDLTNKREVKNKYVVSPIMHDETVGIFCQSRVNEPIDVNVIVNSDIYNHQIIGVNQWSYTPLCAFEDLKTMTIIINNKEVTHFNFEDDDLLKNVFFKQKCFFKY